MAKHNDLGKAGENAAVLHLEEKGYSICHRNWRKGHLELDIIATNGKELVVAEVKTRSNTEFARPEDAVNLAKVKRTVRAADTYMKIFQIDIPVRFDIITVIGDNEDFKIEHMEEAFFPPLF
ncbi:YraN family protein [uncultured Bacteroides sp.]|jgi:Predicted endonuclease distantly related to archaeal Holliday junction resolvase|uniref:YraN family protein n=1 Tax=uncultured Bacteroides sp. TaxID=162156 RepID=UPI002675B36F|nr:YraN family protein [uncultured Bacteroides sp.]